MSKSTTGLRRAGLATLAVSLTMGGGLLAATPASADWATAGGEIGLVDTDTSSNNGTQGATLVYPGATNQDLGDIRLLIPNSFQNGDTIDLVLFDRSADAMLPDRSPGQINADAAHRVGFNNVPTVTVNPTPHDPTTSIGPSSIDGPSNTEGTTAIGNAPDPDTTAPVATQPPVFTASLVQSSRANGLADDIIRLRVNGVQASTGDSEWVVTLSDLNVDLGASVSPGELRVVPFAYNGTPAQTGTNASPMFAGNLPDTDLEPETFDPTIGIYTVPAYVAPVTFNVGTPNNILADGTTQRVGDITVAETNNYSLQAGTYTIDIDGATIENDDASPVTIEKSGGGTGTPEQDTLTDLTWDSDSISFTLGNDSDTTKLTAVLRGLLLSSNSQGPITYTVSGGSIDDFMADPAGTSPEIGTPDTNPGVTGVPADSEFSLNVNQDDIAAPEFEISALATPLESRIGGGDRYETAAKIALNNSSYAQYVILASGENFPDALSSGYLSNQVGGASILLTRQDRLPQVTKSAMRELGTQTVFIVGGPSAVSNDVERELRNTRQYYPGGEGTYGDSNLHVVRLAGDNRYETNKKVNEYAAAVWDGANPVGRTNIEFGEASKLTALVATGEDFADALAAGPATVGAGSWWWDDEEEVAVYGGLPLILTRTGSLSPEASSQMQNLGIEQAVIVGGPSAVSTTVQTAIEGLDADVLRLEGDNRYDTATAVADFVTAPAYATASESGGLGFDDWAGDNSEGAYLATGEKFADALAGGPLAGGNGSPLLLTRSASLPTETQAWLSANAGDYGWLTALGLGAAVAPSVLDAANAAISAQ